MPEWCQMTEEQKEHTRAVRRAREATAEHKAKRSAKRRERWAYRRNLITEMFGGKCEQCGCTSNLEWNHRYPSQKTSEFSDDIECSLDNFMERHGNDLQLLCHSCHHAMSVKQQQVAWELLCNLSPEEYDTLMSR